jgi:hypothetical protein
MPDSQQSMATADKKQQVQKIAEALLASGEKLTDEEVRQMQSTTDALLARASEEHHDHDHKALE